MNHTNLKKKFVTQKIIIKRIRLRIKKILEPIKKANIRLVNWKEKNFIKIKKKSKEWELNWKNNIT